MFRRIALAATLAFTLAGPAAAQGTLNMPCAPGADWCEAIAAAFQRETGIRVAMARKSAGEILAQIRAEAQNPRTDIWFGASSETHFAAAEAGLLQTYTSPNMAALHPWARDTHRMAGGHCVGVSSGAIGFAWNRELMARRNLPVPTSWADLLRPEYQRAFALEWTASGALLFSGGAWHSLFTTIQLAAIAAPITAGLGLLAAWVLTRQRLSGRTALEFALMLTFAVPGTVIGVAYILTFNLPPLEITGTAAILVACFVFRNLPVGVRSGVAAMSQLDKSLDEAAMTLRASTFRTLRTVVLPLLKPAIVTALVYSFVRAMTTVSAVIFLVSAEYEMATVFIINRVINGDYGLAIAYCAVLMMTVIGLVNLAIGRRNLGRRAAAPVVVPAGGRA